MCLLFEYAATLGLVDVAFTSPMQARGDIHDLTAREQVSRYDGLVCFRLTPMGSYCLGTRRVAPPSAVVAVAGLRVTSDLRVLIAGELTAADRLMLETCALISEDGSWRLDRSQILDAVEKARPVARFREFLQRRAEGRLPNEAAVFLANCEQRGGALSLRNRLVAVFIGYEPAFRRALRRVGYGIAETASASASRFSGRHWVSWFLERSADRARSRNHGVVIRGGLREAVNSRRRRQQGRTDAAAPTYGPTVIAADGPGFSEEGPGRRPKSPAASQRKDTKLLAVPGRIRFVVGAQ